MKQFAVNIREARKTKGFSQYQVAKEIQCPPTTFAGWEQGKFSPNRQYHSALSTLLDLSIDQLTDTNEYQEATFNELILEQVKQIDSFEQIEETVASEQLSDLIKGYWILNEKERYQLIEVMKILISSRKYTK